MAATLASAPRSRNRESGRGDVRVASGLAQGPNVAAAGFHPRGVSVRAAKWYQSAMLIGRLVALASRSPVAKRLLWRGWYQFLATRYPDRRWTFMNYGFHAGVGPKLDPRDEPDRSCIQLYDVVAGAVPLRGLDVLEVGCGRGGGASYVARYLGPRRVVAVDLAPRAVAWCRQRHADVPDLSFQVGDAERLPFPDAQFDAVLNVESSHCYGHPPSFFAEVRRVLKPGGHFLYADFRPREEIDPWMAALRDAGFRVQSETDLTPGVVAALDIDHDRKRSFIGELVDRPLAGIFREFAALRGTELYGLLRDGGFSYRGFVSIPA